MDFELEAGWIEPTAAEPVVLALAPSNETEESSLVATGGPIDIDKALALFGHYVEPSSYDSLPSVRIKRELGMVARADGGSDARTTRARRRRRSKDEPCDCWGCRRSRNESKESAVK
jgi:hypothetical protein